VSEAGFRTICLAAFDGVLVHEEGVIVEATDKCLALFGCEVGDMVGKTLLDFTAPATHTTVQAHAEDTSSESYESIGRRKNGEEFPLEVCGISMEDSLARVVAFRDISARKAEERLHRAQAERFRSLAQAGFDGIAVHREGTIREVNDPFAAMFGYETAEIIGMPMKSLAAHPENRDSAEGNGIGNRHESFGLRKDGSSFPVEICAVVMPDGNDVAAYRDISRRRAAELTLVQNEDRFRDLVENSPDLICTHDLGGRILSVNSMASRALKMPLEELCSMNVQDMLAPGQAEGYAAYASTLTRDGTAAGTMRVVTNDGRRRIWEYQSTLRTAGVSSPIVRGAARDVTEREEGLRAVRRSEEHFRSIIENASDVIAIIERDGRLRYHSPSVRTVLGYEQGVLVGTAFADLVHPGDQDAVAEFLARQVAEADANQTIDVRLLHHNGAWRSFEIVAKNLVEKERASAIVVNARDITDRRLLECQLAQANRITSLGHLAATVAHEFNNVLMGMQPFAELMQRPDASAVMISKGASHIASSIQRGKRIALDILRFTQPAEPAPEVFDLGEYWQKFAPEAEAMVGNSTRLLCRIPFRGMRILADKTQLSQVLSNLIANARDAMPTGGSIMIQAGRVAAQAVFPFGVIQQPENFVQLSVIDDGAGMPPAVRERVFEPLFTTKQHGGTGLGLAIAHQVLKQNHGEIFVESQPGLGTSFHLFLPAATAGAHKQKKSAARKQRPLATRLLMVEDELVIVDGITALLETEGIEVEAGRLGSDAVAAVARFHPDVVLLDFGLPDMDGAEVYLRIRSAAPSLPIIFATGHGDRHVIQEGLGDARTRFLQKPFEMAALLTALAELE